MKLTIHPSFLVVATLAAGAAWAFSQGSLTPPGTPAPTMKTLAQVEPRTLVSAANTPGDSTNTFIISQPGSYYLAGNLTAVSGKNGISIQASDVTLDLNGFALLGDGVGGGGAPAESSCRPPLPGPVFASATATSGAGADLACKRRRPPR